MVIQKAVKEDLKVLRSVFEELAEMLAAHSVESATEFANEVFSEVERVSAAQVEIDPLPDKEDYQVDVKIVSDGIARQVHKKLRANTVKGLLRRIKKSLPILKFLQLDPAVREYLRYALFYFWQVHGLQLIVLEGLAVSYEHMTA